MTPSHRAQGDPAALGGVDLRAGAVADSLVLSRRRQELPTADTCVHQHSDLDEGQLTADASVRAGPEGQPGAARGPVPQEPFGTKPLWIGIQIGVSMQIP